jgi:hypothetical protein
LRQFHVNELGVHVLEVGQDEELFECGVVAHPFLDAELVAIQPGLTFNYGGFAGIKLGVVDG